MRDWPARIEQDLTQTAAEVLEQFSEKLAQAELSFRGLEVHVVISDPAQYSSELRIMFYRNANLHDVFEFFLFRDGRQTVGRDEVRVWMAKQLEDLVLR